MAFFKKSNDPWDVDPEKRKKEREKEARRAERQQEKGELAALVDEIKEWNDNRKAKREAEENLPPEKCPWCGKDMKKYYLTGGELGLSEKRPHAWLGTPVESKSYLSDNEWMNPYKLTWYCADCGKLVMNVRPEEVGPRYTWEDGTPKFQEEEDDAYERYCEQVKKYQ